MKQIQDPPNLISLRKAYEISQCKVCKKSLAMFIEMIEDNIRRNERLKKIRVKEYTRHKKKNCQVCKEENANLHVHHIDENHKNNRENNLLTVCPNCHSLIHTGKRGKKKMLPLQVYERAI